MYLRRLISILLMAGALVGSAVFLLPEKNAGPSSSLVEIYSRGMPSAPSILLEIPHKFRYRSSIGAEKTSGVNILTYYPSFTSLADWENFGQSLRGCVGYCNGRILISITNIITGITSDNFINKPTARSRGFFEYYHSKDPHVRIVDLAPQFGFDLVFDKLSGQHFGFKNRYLLRSSADKSSYELAADCSMDTPYHVCTLAFSLSCNPAIAIEIDGWKYEYMDKALDLQRDVDRFISAMVKQPECEIR